MPISAGETIDNKYRVVRHIGSGGMGSVFEGENVLIGRRVAIKLLHAEVAQLPGLVERFEREAKAAARIGSPFICDVLDLGFLPSGERYIVMEFLEGVSLDDRLAERGKLSPLELAPIAYELLEGLAAMHAAGVVHRDLKPANVFLATARGGRGEVVKILDFGIAKLEPLGGEVGSMTRTGAMMGTPLYMSPEQARGARDIDARSDLFSASVIFYEALTGSLPHEASNMHELLFKVALEDARAIREVAPDVDGVLADLVQRGLARDLAARWPSAAEYTNAISSWWTQIDADAQAFAAGLRIGSSSRRLVASPVRTPPGGVKTALSWSEPTEDGGSSRASPGVGDSHDASAVRVGTPPVSSRTSFAETQTSDAVGPTSAAAPAASQGLPRADDANSERDAAPLGAHRLPEREPSSHELHLEPSAGSSRSLRHLSRFGAAVALALAITAFALYKLKPSSTSTASAAASVATAPVAPAQPSPTLSAVTSEPQSVPPPASSAQAGRSAEARPSAQELRSALPAGPTVSNVGARPGTTSGPNASDPKAAKPGAPPSASAEATGARVVGTRTASSDSVSDDTDDESAALRTPKPRPAASASSAPPTGSSAPGTLQGRRYRTDL